ncbi:cytochrome c oxidase assembly protein [Roseovarius aquimarinus]|uniref:Cytochrome c oxidase assembly protein n=1 Tax=Roseovarius aquimarinus TaxID=1229156 RepID=A0ABW7I476_9RHOB
MEDAYIPFCGTPPAPADLWGRWLFDPLLMAGLAAFALVLVWKARAPRAAVAGWVLVALLFVSPLCAASMALFSARVAQHVLLTLVAAPLLALAAPAPVRMVMPAAIGFWLLFWGWHAPLPYAATLGSDLIYWAMHLSLLGAAWVLWSAIFRVHASQPQQALFGLALTAAQMSLLSALLVFSTAVWHGWHQLTVAPYGISALADQQLAGAVMWSAGGALMLAVVALLVRSVLRGGEPAMTRIEGKT